EKPGGDTHAGWPGGAGGGGPGDAAAGQHGADCSVGERERGERPCGEPGVNLGDERSGVPDGAREGHAAEHGGE
ncbi:hypothetical protein QQB70_004891, partial [Salmonella enterica]|nr:hypothetical protein [Salmonella enterica]EFR2617123.1 hypothetical protein [Salmonella enterica]EJH2877473.1 hypothetical protein [Salmonella enterica]ELD5803125.1 hypothetical protein [Salmonella enterica]